MRLCKYCFTQLTHHAAKVCDACFKMHIMAYGKAYREKNRKACQERSKRSQEKKKEYYRAKRREYYRKVHGISLDDPFQKRKNGEGNIDAQGYKTITKRGHPNQMDEKGRIREHVFVMSEHLKRPLKKGESVHHKNGDRLDNRIENLELWVKGQPAGQRVEDKIKWCIEFLKEYGYGITVSPEQAH
jgi:HNH endonuclease